MIKRAIIIGASTVGKTALVKYLLGKKFALPVMESDGVLIALNGGAYPKSSEYKMRVLAPKMVKDVLERDKILFFTNTHYFSLEDIRNARSMGFKIIQLVLDRDKMTERSKLRQEKEGYGDHTKYFGEMLAYQKEIFDSGVVDAVIDTDRPVEDLASEIQSYLNL